MQCHSILPSDLNYFTLHPSPDGDKACLDCRGPLSRAPHRKHFYIFFGMQKEALETCNFINASADQVRHLSPVTCLFDLQETQVLLSI